MIRFVGLGLPALLLLALWLYCIFDVIAADSVLVRNLPKGFWLVLVIFGRSERARSVRTRGIRPPPPTRSR